MSTTPTHQVWDLAGRPAPQGAAAALLKDQPAACAVCGLPADRTADVNRALGANFTDRSIFRDPGSTRVCRACLWCCSGKPPATVRMWTVVAAPGTDLPASNPKAWLQDRPGLYLGARGDVTGALVAQILADPPAGDWTVTVALSGQKHVLPYGAVNRGHGPWTVRMETVTVTSTPAEWAHVHAHALALRRLGVPADDIRVGQPRYLKTAADLTAWREHSIPLTPYLESPLLDLALWSITKGHLA